ncbi:MAG: polyprenyl synthetase family protein [Dehalococcoidia bacterium]|nr:polyprenyl synthetase family protein [Dehalococcoidia bacterium]
MNTAVIFEPVQKDMLLVEEQLQSIARVEFPILSELLSYVLQSKGKRIRPAITLLVGKLNEYDLNLLIPIATAVEALHTATLVHDDMIDNAPIRRGRPTLNSAWNKGSAVLAGDFLFAKSAEFAAMTDNIRITRLFARTIMIICSGELRQMFEEFDWEHGKDDYFKKIESKTAALFASAAESAAILSAAPEKSVSVLRDYGMALGMAFQIVDDILDFVGDQEVLGKPVGNDLLQGTITLPAILLAERYPDDFDPKKLFRNGGNEQAAQRAIEMIRNSVIIEDCYVIARRYANLARESILSLPSSPHAFPLIALVDNVVERRL